MYDITNNQKSNIVEEKYVTNSRVKSTSGIVLIVVAVLILMFPPVWGILLCGGFLVISAIAAVLGDTVALVGTGTIAVLSLLLLAFALWRYAKKRTVDTTIIDSKENVRLQNMSYIKKERARGIPDEQIKQVFKSGGWSNNEIESIFTKIN